MEMTITNPTSRHEGSGRPELRKARNQHSIDRIESDQDSDTEKFRESNVPTRHDFPVDPAQSAIVVLVILRSLAGRTVAGSSGGDSSFLERMDGSVI